MPNDAEKKSESKNNMEEEPKIELGKLKKPTYIISGILSLIGMIIALVLAFLINGALDDVQVSIDSNINSITTLLSDLENSVTGVQGEVLAFNETLDRMGTSITTLATGINKTGTTVKSFGQTLSGLSLLGTSFEGYSSDLSAAGDSLISGADDLIEVGVLTGEKEEIGKLSDALDSVKQDLRTQRLKVIETGDAILFIIDRIKLANMLVFVMFVVMFGVLLLNSAAGIL